MPQQPQQPRSPLFPDEPDPLSPLQGGQNEFLRQLGFMATRGSWGRGRGGGERPVSLSDVMALQRERQAGIQRQKQEQAEAQEESFGGLMGAIAGDLLQDPSGGITAALARTQEARTVGAISGPQFAGAMNTVLEAQRERDRAEIVEAQENRAEAQFQMARADRRRQIEEREAARSMGPGYARKVDWMGDIQAGLHGEVPRSLLRAMADPRMTKWIGGNRPEDQRARKVLQDLWQEQEENPSIAFDDTLLESALLGERRRVLQPAAIADRAIADRVVGAILSPGSSVDLGNGLYFSVRGDEGTVREMRALLGRPTSSLLGTSTGEETEERPKKVAEAVRSVILGMSPGGASSADAASLDLATQMQDLMGKMSIHVSLRRGSSEPEETVFKGSFDEAPVLRGDGEPELYPTWKVASGLWAVKEDHTGYTSDLVADGQGNLSHQPTVALRNGMSLDEARAFLKDYKMAIAPHRGYAAKLHERVARAFNEGSVVGPLGLTRQEVDEKTWELMPHYLERRSRAGDVNEEQFIKEFWGEVGMPRVTEFILNQTVKPGGTSTSKSGSQRGAARGYEESAGTADAMRMAHEKMNEEVQALLEEEAQMATSLEQMGTLPAQQERFQAPEQQQGAGSEPLGVPRRSPFDMPDSTGPIKRSR